MTTTARSFKITTIQLDGSPVLALRVGIFQGRYPLRCSHFAQAMAEGIEAVVFVGSHATKVISVEDLDVWISKDPVPSAIHGDHWPISFGPETNTYAIADSDRPGSVLLDAGITADRGYHNPTLKRLVERLRRAKVRSFTILPFEGTYGSVKIER